VTYCMQIFYRFIINTPKLPHSEISTHSEDFMINAFVKEILDNGKLLYQRQIVNSSEAFAFSLQQS